MEDCKLTLQPVIAEAAPILEDLSITVSEHSDEPSQDQEQEDTSFQHSVKRNSEELVKESREELDDGEASESFEASDDDSQYLSGSSCKKREFKAERKRQQTENAATRQLWRFEVSSKHFTQIGTIGRQRYRGACRRTRHVNVDSSCEASP